MSNCGDLRDFIDVLAGRVEEHLHPGKTLSMQGEGSTKRFKVRVGESDLTVVYRSTDTVREISIQHDLAEKAIIELLADMGLKDVSNAMTKWGYIPRSVTVSYVVPSEALYLLVEGVRGRVPTVRVSIREDSYEASASYCVISEGENVCAYLKELIDALSKVRECLITYAR